MGKDSGIIITTIIITNLTQSRVTWEKGTSVEELLSLYWSAGLFLAALSWQLIYIEGLLRPLGRWVWLFKKARSVAISFPSWSLHQSLLEPLLWLSLVIGNGVWSGRAVWSKPFPLLSGFWSWHFSQQLKPKQNIGAIRGWLTRSKPQHWAKWTVNSFHKSMFQESWEYATDK